MHPKELSINDYIYHLPEDRIANFPSPERDASKLLIYDNGKITEDIYKNLDQHLPSNSLLIFNDSKVIEARLLFQKPTGGVIEIFCLEPHEQYPDIATAMMQQGSVLWQCLIGGASKWKHGQLLEKKIRNPSEQILLHATYVEKKVDSFVIRFSWDAKRLSFAEVLHIAGAVPLPPYIKRDPEKLDAERYQTVYAHYEGSVAAPTAGLHFTDNLLKKIKEKNIKTAFVTLHVGAGTFKPVKSATMENHQMHAEFINVSKQTIHHILENISDNVIPVGTTSLRTIESLYWLGVKLSMANGEWPMKKTMELGQWEAYEPGRENIDAASSLQTLISFMTKNGLERLLAKTQIIIAPGYAPKIATGMITNFHQPQSTLLLLVAALIGDDWRKVYDYAIENNFRFLSYGDGCLLWFDQSKREPGR